MAATADYLLRRLPPPCPLCGGSGRGVYAEATPAEPFYLLAGPHDQLVELLDGPCRLCRPEDARRWADGSGRAVFVD